MTLATIRAANGRCRRSSWLMALAMTVALLCAASDTQAQIAVVANLTPDPMPVATVADAPPPGEKPKPLPPGDRGARDQDVHESTIASGDVVAIWVGSGGILRLTANSELAHKGDAAAVYWLSPGQAYYITQDPQAKSTVVREIELGAVPEAAYPGRREVTEVTVKLLVDDNEPTRAEHWHSVLADRMAAASRIFERTCRVRFKVVQFDTWNSPPETEGLEAGIEAMERLVDPGPARIAIGFASQYGPPDASHPHLGIVRGVLGRHVLIRERPGRLTEPEKLEILVHELGHYFGAVHIAHARSVMRPRLGDGQARLRGFRIAFDPLNALIMNHYVTELGTGRLPGEFPAPVTARIKQLQRAIDNINGHPVEASEVIARTEERKITGPSAPGANPPMRTPATPPHTDVDRALSAAGTLLAEFQVAPPTGITGDALTDWYVRRAARAAQRLPADIAPQAFLLALGIGFEDQGFLARVPFVGGQLRRLETEAQRQQRLRNVGQASLHGRHDWALHFFVSALLTARTGGPTAGLAGFLKEVADAGRGSGFDPSDLAADHAGIAWARRVLQRRVLLIELAEEFRTSDVRLENGVK